MSVPQGVAAAQIRHQKIVSSAPLIEPRSAGAEPVFVVQALYDAVIYRTRQAAEPCEACVTHPSLLCIGCQSVMDLASVYRMLADQFMAEGKA